MLYLVKKKDAIWKYDLMDIIFNLKLDNFDDNSNFHIKGMEGILFFHLRRYKNNNVCAQLTLGDSLLV